MGQGHNLLLNIILCGYKLWSFTHLVNSDDSMDMEVQKQHFGWTSSYICVKNAYINMK